MKVASELLQREVDAAAEMTSRNSSRISIAKMQAVARRSGWTHVSEPLREILVRIAQGDNDD